MLPNPARIIAIGSKLGKLGPQNTPNLRLFPTPPAIKNLPKKIGALFQNSKINFSPTDGWGSCKTNFKIWGWVVSEKRSSAWGYMNFSFPARFAYHFYAWL